MAIREVFNPATGERFWFDDAQCDDAGRVRQLRYELAPGNTVPMHRHPGTAQRFEVVSGCLHVETAAGVCALQAGEQLACEPGDAHRQWNAGTVPVVAIDGYEPPLDIEPFFTEMAAMGACGDLKPGGAPRNIFKFAVFVHDHAAVTRIASPAAAAAVATLAALARFAGLARWYRRAGEAKR